MAALEARAARRGSRSLRSQSLASALVADVQGTHGDGGMTGTEAYNARSDVRYMGDTLVPTGGGGGIGLELAGAVPNGLDLGAKS
jgi:hypothetical protein